VTIGAQEVVADHREQHRASGSGCAWSEPWRAARCRIIDRTPGARVSSIQFCQE
jgi:hypothetical protein